MKPILVVPMIFTALTGGAHAAGYVMDLSGTTPNQELVPNYPLPGIDDWQQSEANNSPDRPKAWINPIQSSTGIGFGPRFDDLSSDPFLIARDTSLGMAGSSLSMKLELVDSFFVPSRNDFFFGLTNFSGFNLFTVNFLADPDSNGSWLMDVNGMEVFGQLVENTPYDFFVSFDAAGEDMEYSIEVVSPDNFLVGSSQGVVEGGGDSIIGSLAFGVTTGNLSADYGDNYMSVADVSFIPEPSTTLLSALAMIGLLARRKRA